MPGPLKVQLLREMRAAHVVCDEEGDVASASLLENATDPTERRAWFPWEASRGG